MDDKALGKIFQEITEEFSEMDYYNTPQKLDRGLRWIYECHFMTYIFLTER